MAILKTYPDIVTLSKLMHRAGITSAHRARVWVYLRVDNSGGYTSAVQGWQYRSILMCWALIRLRGKPKE